MMGKKIVLTMLILIFAMSFSACGEQKAAGQASDEQTTGSAGLEWPSQYMSTLPVPDSKITFIEKLNGTETIAEEDTTTQPSSVNVTMNEMTKEEATAYYEGIKDSGFVISTDKNDKDQILLVGTLNDADANPFLFSYTPEDGFGNVSITIMKGMYTEKTDDTPESPEKE